MENQERACWRCICAECNRKFNTIPEECPHSDCAWCNGEMYLTECGAFEEKKRKAEIEKKARKANINQVAQYAQHGLTDGGEEKIRIIKGCIFSSRLEHKEKREMMKFMADLEAFLLKDHKLKCKDG